MPDSIQAGQITFYSYWLPALAPGEYSVSVQPDLTATVKAPGSDKLEEKALSTQAVTETVHIGGPRYALTGAEAYTCYPAPGQVGRFFDTLPHIVFDRCTLPWERTIDGSDPTDPPKDRQPYPSLALILLTDADFSPGAVPPIVSRTLAELLNPGNNVVGPAFKLDPYDSDADPCQAIDLPAAKFKEVMPRKDDLPYLAHVRQVETSAKETWSLLKDGKFSVVICNRFPESQAASGEEKDWGIVNTVCLVSLEGWGAYLDRPEGLDAGKSCRLLVLGSWRFTCQGESDFKSQMKTDLDDKRLLRRPLLRVNSSATGGEDQAINHINDALKMGFAPINHDLRYGDTAISWYRGPLVPMEYGMSTSYEDISCADAAQRYNPQTGMFDASYAAAWQLGRLLALRDEAFAQALFRFRTDYQRWVRKSNTDTLSRMERSGEQADGTLVRLKPGLGDLDTLRDWYVQTLSKANYLRTGAAAAQDQPSRPPEFPATVQDWLGQALLLYGVPFQYLVPDDAMLLVPDDAMLPAKSIRFFYLNPEWINCLLQGACSVGRTSRTDELVDQLLRARFFEVSETVAERLRSSKKQEADRHRNGTGPAATPPQPLHGKPKIVLNWPLTGYLLRSPAVEAWIGLEAKAYADASTNEPLQILRMDRLAPDVLLCIYNGKVNRLEIKQPPEAVHFGAASSAGNKDAHEKVNLRIIQQGRGTMGDALQLGKNEVVKVPLYENGKRVIKVAELAKTIKKTLIDQKPAQWTEQAAFTSAEFAVQMIEAPAKVTFSADFKT